MVAHSTRIFLVTLGSWIEFYTIHITIPGSQLLNLNKRSTKVYAKFLLHDCVIIDVHLDLVLSANKYSAF